jgi:hypothetical protein
MLEFAFAGIATITLLFSTIQLSIGMWHYHTLAYAVHEATRRVSVHGRGCVTGTTLCPITIGDIVTGLAADSVGIPATAMNATLTTDSGATTICNPTSSCTNDMTRWPPSSNLDNATGKHVTITATYTFANSILIIWPGAFSNGLNALQFPASSTETIVF